jgi:hypothetical protein
MGLSPAEIIKTICPELSGSPSLPVYLEMAVESTSAGFFGKMYDYAVAYKAAHLFTLMDGGTNISDNVQKIGGGAPVASMSEGGVSISFAQNSGDTDKADMGSTKYGKMLASLIKSRPSISVNQSVGGLV